MIQLDILSGKKAGGQTVVRHFPFRIGRAAENDLQLEDDGVWDRHLVLEFQKKEGFKLATSAKRPRHRQWRTRPKQNPPQTATTVTIGSAKLQFWLAAAQQRGLHAREFFLWALIIAVTLGHSS